METKKFRNNKKKTLDIKLIRPEWQDTYDSKDEEPLPA